MTPDRSRLRALAEAATAGPWVAELDGSLHDWMVTSGDLVVADMPGEASEDHRERNAAFIAAAQPQAVLALLDALATAEARAAKAEAASADSLARLDRLRDRAVKLEAEVADGERACLEVIEERDLAHEQIAAIYHALPGAREDAWIARVPPEEPPDSGDAGADALALVQELLAERDAARAEEAALRDAFAPFVEAWEQLSERSSYEQRAIQTFRALGGGASESIPGGDVSLYFGLSYASYLVWPRALMEAMPADWQARFFRLGREIDAEFEWPKDRYGVLVGWTTDDGTVLPPKHNRDPLRHYRRASPELIDQYRSKCALGGGAPVLAVEITGDAALDAAVAREAVRRNDALGGAS